MKRLLAVVVVSVLLGPLLVFVVPPIYAQAYNWTSYSDLDHTTECNCFTAYPSTVYMHGEGWGPKGTYALVYWDGGGDKRVLEDPILSDLSGNLNSSHTFGGSDVNGTWYATVYVSGQTPASHNDNTSLILDANFTVAQSAIPEFPTVIAGIGVAGLCFGIYYWMRRERLKFKIKNSR